MQSNAELVGAVLRGERFAFEELVRRYERAAWTTAWRVVRDYHVSVASLACCLFARRWDAVRLARMGRGRVAQYQPSREPSPDCST